MGCSTAYHLAKLGWKDVVLLEQGRLSGGTTWHAAGLVGQLRSYQNLTRLIRYSTELYSKLEAETGLATGWKQCGSLSVARTEERMVLLRRSAAMANAQGVACEPLTPKQAGEKYPIMRTDDLVGAVWLPGDGKANPADITQALAKRRAQRRRAHLREDPRDRRSTPRTDASPACRRPKARSRPRSSSTAPASGRARSAAWSASRCRSIPASTCTSSPRRWRTCRATCR